MQMFVPFSWHDFLLFTGILLLLYLMVLVVTCYRKDILKVFGRKGPLREAMDAPVQRPDLLPMVHELVSKISTIIRAGSQNNMVMPELLEAIKQELREFSILEPTEYKAKINLYILQELEIHGIDLISLQQIEQCWKFT